MSVEKMFPKQGENLPEIRFKGFSGEWVALTLGDYTTFRRGSFPQPYGNKEWYGGEGSMPFVQVVDVSKDLSLAEDTKQKISLKAQLRSVFVQKGSVVVTLQGTIGRVAITQYDSFVDRTILIFESFSKKTDSSFWAYTIQNKFDLEKKRAPGGTIKTITKEALSSFDVLIPTTEEQTQIGNYFQKLDSLINQHQQKHDKLSNIKKAMLELMFPKQGENIPEIRFKEFSGEWEEIQLSEEVTFINGRAYSQEELQDKGKYTVLRVGNFYTNSSWYYSDMELGDKYYANFGDLLYTWSASFGPHIWDGDKVIYHYHIWKLELSENVDKLFLLHLLDYDRAKILSGSNGSTMIHITKFAMEAKKVFIPKKDEQSKIGNYFQKLDTLINQHQQQITKLNNIKQACLSKMFV